MWEEGKRSLGNFPLWVGKAKLPELPRFSDFFQYSGSLRNGLAKNQLNLSMKLLPFSRSLFASTSVHKTFFSNPQFFFFFLMEKSTFSGKSWVSPHSLGQVLDPVTFSHGFSYPFFPACPTQPSKLLSPHCQ